MKPLYREAKIPWWRKALYYLDRYGWLALGWLALIGGLAVLAVAVWDLPVLASGPFSAGGQDGESWTGSGTKGGVR